MNIDNPEQNYFLINDWKDVVYDEIEELQEELEEIKEDSIESLFFDQVTTNLSQKSRSRFLDVVVKLNQIRIEHNISVKAIKSISDLYMDLITNPPKESFFNEGISKITKSKYLLDKSIKRMPNYISPIRYKNLKYDINFVYMPIKKIIPQLMSEAVTASILKENDSNVSAYVKENKLARTIRLILYADDFGMVNPIGYAKGRHKILAFYMDIDCPIELRQKSRSIPFVILAERNKNLKSENLVLVLKPFIDELLILQFYLEKFDIELPVKLAFIIGDNLSVAELLGFKQTFGPGFICRYCQHTYKQIKNPEIRCSNPLNITLSDEVLRTEIDKVKSNKNHKSTFGIKYPSPFLHMDLNIFKISPPDVFHDFTEGVLATLLSFILKKTKINWDELDRRMSRIKWINEKITIGPQFQINGKAAQKFEFFTRLIEIFPEWVETTSISEFYDISRKVIHRIFNKSENSGSSELDSLISSFIEMMETNNMVTPKLHFISHYSEMMNFYGNLGKFATMC
uniref:Uncharacterized protein LOC113792503 n=1 Tax=Dermatophagoides pteronyssinus TaxID=6956 RepID=A0A6P6XYD9_DERPT